MPITGVVLLVVLGIAFGAEAVHGLKHAAKATVSHLHKKPSVKTQAKQ
jgi:hypothetical protein